jgi:hypothetical protein
VIGCDGATELAKRQQCVDPTQVWRDSSVSEVGIVFPLELCSGLWWVYFSVFRSGSAEAPRGPR